MSVGRARLRRALRKTGFWLSVFVIVSPAILVFLWMFARAQDRDRQHRLSTGVHSQSTDARQLCFGVRAECHRPIFLNSLVVSGGATLVALLIGVPAGFGIARANAQRLTVVILIARMTPALSYLIPLFAVFQFLRLNNTLPRS